MVRLAVTFEKGHKEDFLNAGNPFRILGGVHIVVVLEAHSPLVICTLFYCMSNFNFEMSLKMQALVAIHLEDRLEKIFIKQDR